MGPPRPLLSSASAARANLALRHDGTGGGGISAAVTTNPSGLSAMPSHATAPCNGLRPHLLFAPQLLATPRTTAAAGPRADAARRAPHARGSPLAHAPSIRRRLAPAPSIRGADNSEKGRTRHSPRSACSWLAPDPHAAHLRRCRGTEAVDEGRCERRGGDAEGEERAEGVVLRTAVEERRLVRKDSVFGNLTNMRELNLRENDFNRDLPKTLLILPQIKILDLSWNSLVGGIPTSSSSDKEPASLEKCHMIFTFLTAFRYLRNIRELDLSSNQFSGNLSAFLFSLPHIERLDLSGNWFLGPIPLSPSSNLSSSLKSLRFSQNNLSGKLSFYWLRNLTKLEEVDLSGNTNLAVHVNIPGWVPPFQLKRLALSGCDLDRAIIEEPHFLPTQIYLEELDLSNNNLSGSMPNWLFTKEATLVNLDLGYNSLTGSLDPIGHPQTALQYMSISNNHITGQLPMGFGSMFPCLSTLDFRHNNFYGHIPMSLCHINRMRLLDLSNNNFSGELPACVFTDFPDMRIFSISNTQLEGTLPRLLSGSLLIISLHDNKLSGELDTSFWNLSRLAVLNLSGNRMTSNIHPKICNLTSIEILDLSDNNFSGPIPKCSSTYLSSLNLAGNSFSGDISRGLFSTPNLIILDMRYNKLTGNLSWLEDLDSITVLSLGWNEFEGQVTPNFSLYSLELVISAG
ncbi:receptor-like protein 14 [Panicum virgatum]|uniref:receptor-like protein 14 n=1 Tax=Panicum virgatum TaxID=38727 RepID=UPI0019D6920D|nr:receptor-like protein 14 [Panicum virgatum]